MTRLIGHNWTTLCLLAMTGFMLLSRCGVARGESVDLWIGTGGNHGLYHCTLDDDAGQLTTPQLASDKMAGPGFLAMHPSGEVLYAVGNVDGRPSVGAWRIGSKQGDEQSVALEWIGSVDIGDAGPCHVSVSPDGRMLLTAQYGGGSVAAYRLSDDGSIAEQTSLHRHGQSGDPVAGGGSPSGVISHRQSDPHPHWSGFSPDGRFALVPDLGMDRVVIYRVDADAATITPHGYAEAIPGGGPRHMKFSADGRHVYVVNEMDLSISVFDYDAKTAAMTRVQTVATVPKELLAKEEFKTASEVRVSGDGRFVYAANRGHDTITVFAAGEDGRLTVVEREPVRVATPRNFNLSSSGRWMVVGGQTSDNVSIFTVGDDGELAFHRQVVPVPVPICFVFGG